MRCLMLRRSISGYCNVDDSRKFAGKCGCHRKRMVTEILNRKQALSAEQKKFQTTMDLGGLVML